MPTTIRRIAACCALLLVAAPAHAETDNAKSAGAKEGSRKHKKKSSDVKAGEAKAAAPTPTPTKTPQDDAEYGPQLPPPPPSTDNVLVAAPPRPAFGRGKLMVAVRAGADFPEVLSNFGPSFLVGVEVGWLLPRLPGIGEGLAITLDGAYSMPEASGTVADPRVDGGNYKWGVNQQVFSLGLTVLYRVQNVMGGRLTPYVGIGPRLFLLQSVASAQPANGSASSFNETSTRAGFGVPLGVDYALGPGRLFLEAMFTYAPFNHDSTGSTNAGALSVEAGYRMLFSLGG